MPSANANTNVGTDESAVAATSRNETDYTLIGGCASNEKQLHHSFAIRFITSIHRIWYFISVLCIVSIFQSIFEIRYWEHFELTNIKAFARKPPDRSFTAWQTQNRQITKELNTYRTREKDSCWCFVYECKKASLMFHHLDETKENSRNRNICSTLIRHIHLVHGFFPTAATAARGWCIPFPYAVCQLPTSLPIRNTFDTAKMCTEQSKKLLYFVASSHKYEEK